MLKNRDAVLLWALLVFLTLWLSSTGPFRWMADDTVLRSHWILGVTPNFFAGATLTLWQAYGTRTGPIASACLALAVLGGAELIQLALPQHRADPWDFVASLAGAGPAMLIIRQRAIRLAASAEAVGAEPLAGVG